MEHLIEIRDTEPTVTMTVPLDIAVLIGALLGATTGQAGGEFYMSLSAALEHAGYETGLADCYTEERIGINADEIIRRFRDPSLPA